MVSSTRRASHRPKRKSLNPSMFLFRRLPFKKLFPNKKKTAHHQDTQKEDFWLVFYVTKNLQKAFLWGSWHLATLFWKLFTPNHPRLPSARGTSRSSAKRSSVKLLSKPSSPPYLWWRQWVGGRVFLPKKRVGGIMVRCKQWKRKYVNMRVRFMFWV